MTYRNDQEAARARLEVLEAEHAKLVAENQQLRAKKKLPAPTSGIALNEEPLPRVALLFVVVFTVLAIALITYALAA